MKKPETSGGKQAGVKSKNGKSVIPQGEPAPDPKALCITCGPEQTKESALAAAAVTPEINAAFVMKSFSDSIGGVGITELVDCIQAATAKIKAGNLKVLWASEISP